MSKKVHLSFIKEPKSSEKSTNLSDPQVGNFVSTRVTSNVSESPTRDTSLTIGHFIDLPLTMKKSTSKAFLSISRIISKTTSRSSKSLKTTCTEFTTRKKRKPTSNKSGKTSGMISKAKFKSHQSFASLTSSSPSKLRSTVNTTLCIKGGSNRSKRKNTKRSHPSLAKPPTKAKPVSLKHLPNTLYLSLNKKTSFPRHYHLKTLSTKIKINCQTEIKCLKTLIKAVKTMIRRFWLAKINKNQSLITSVSLKFE